MNLEIHRERLTVTPESSILFTRSSKAVSNLQITVTRVYGTSYRTVIGVLSEHTRFDGFDQCLEVSFLQKADMDPQLFNTKSTREGISIGWLTWVTVI